MSSAADLFIKIFPTVVQNLNAVQWLRNSYIQMEGNVTNQGKEISQCIKKFSKKELFLSFFLSKLLVLCPSPPEDFEFCGSANGVKVTNIKESFVPFSQSHRSLLAADLEHDTAISWCHT